MRTTLRSKVTLLFMTLGLVLAIPAVALAAELVVNAEVENAAVTSVTVQQGQTANFNIKVGANGNVLCGSTHTATVAKDFSLDDQANLSVDAFSGNLSFNGGTGTSGNCPIQGGPHTVAASITADANTPTGTYTDKIVLSEASPYFTTTTSSSNGSGGKLDDDTATKITVVVEEAPVTNNAPEVGTAAVNATGVEGDTLQASGSFTDADGDTLSLSADNGTVGTFTDNGDGTWSWSLATNDDVSGGPITVTADDGNGGTATDDFTYSAANANPVLSALSLSGNTGTACLSGNNVSLSFSFSDVGSGDSHSGTINWGDGSANNTFTSSPQNNVQHSYSPGTYTITVTVADDDTGSDSDTASVSRLYNMSAIQSPFNPDGSSVFKYGSTVPVKVTITDCAGTPVSGLSPILGVRLISPTTPALSINEPVYSTSNADTGNTLRYDASSGQYIYNYNTKSNQTPDSSASYYMVVGEASSTPNPVFQKFGLKLK